ncbi:hypothetical protein DKM19_17115 [Streptosporangium sp. 'caverna']|nr:hypothetical protein DKM19_17115 [Streptosporangium sp. 'caverna']
MFRDPGFIRGELDREFQEWSPRMRGILDEVDTRFIWWPLYTVPARQHWRQHTGLTLIGDAAHVMSPFTGQGVNMGLLDALELVTALTSAGHTDVNAAINAYEASMLARMEEAVTATNAAQDILLSPEGPGALLAMASGDKNRQSIDGRP